MVAFVSSKASTRSSTAVIFHSILCHAFFAKNWPQYELDGLVTREMNGEQVILPLWHEITKQEVISHSPSLADKIARTTSTSTIAEIAQEISDVIQSALATSDI